MLVFVSQTFAPSVAQRQSADAAAHDVSSGVDRCLLLEFAEAQPQIPSRSG